MLLCFRCIFSNERYLTILRVLQIVLLLVMDDPSLLVANQPALTGFLMYLLLVIRDYAVSE